MGILLVGSLLKDTLPSLEVEILDGELYTESELEEKVRGSEILGLSANTNNYQNCVKLANYAKRSGTRKVIVGGPHASATLSYKDKKISMAGNILRNQPDIDAAIMYDGGQAFLQYFIESQKMHPDYSGINNLFWRTQEGDLQSNSVDLPTNPPRFTDMDFSLMDFGKYWKEHKREFPDMSEQYVEGFTHVGCVWREKRGCIFCDIPFPFNNYQAPGRFWRDLREARTRLNIRAFKDYGDCLTGNPERVRALLEARPCDLEDMEMSCYGRSNEITEDMANMLRDLNVRYIYIGFDSGDDRMLKSMREGYKVKENHTAIERLVRRGINITGSLILGASGESEETIANTERFAREIVQSPNVTQLHCAILTPFPGAPLNRNFLEDFPEFSDKDVWDTELTTSFWISRNCEAPYELIEKKAREINELNPSSRKRYFGMKEK